MGEHMECWENNVMWGKREWCVWKKSSLFGCRILNSCPETEHLFKEQKTGHTSFKLHLTLKKHPFLPFSKGFPNRSGLIFLVHLLVAPQNFEIQQLNSAPWLYLFCILVLALGRNGTPQNTGNRFWGRLLFCPWNPMGPKCSKGTMVTFPRQNSKSIPKMVVLLVWWTLTL